MDQVSGSTPPTFDDFLEAPDLPLFHDKKQDLRLSEFYTYPDLREADAGVGSKMWKRIKVDNIVGEILTYSRTLITGTEKSGKSSLLKTLFRDVQRLGGVPVYLSGADCRQPISDGALRKAIARSVKAQYAKVTQEQYEQLGCDKKVLLIDDWDKANLDQSSRAAAIEYFSRAFGNVVATATDEFCMQDFEVATSAAAIFKRFDICEFGHVRLQHLATKWLTIGSSPDERGSIAQEVERICKKIEQALRTNAIPHHPWILVVLLKQVDSFDQAAAKNGSYGHLYNAVITAALHGSRFTSVDIKTKYTYLANLAHVLYANRAATISDDEMRGVHHAHCKLYDFVIDYQDLRDDLIATHMLREDAGQIAFRAKYTYCFFLAWYLATNIHKPKTRAIISELSGQLYHEESANTIVFLAHLSSDPSVLDEMKAAAASLFNGVEPILLNTDVEFLEELTGNPAKFKLPESQPAENRQRSVERKDDLLAQKDSSRVDGRTLETHPDPIGKGLKLMHDISSARRTIQILGQVLRNEVGAIQGDDKLTIVKEIFGLARRLLGGFIKSYEQAIPTLTKVLNASFWEEAADRYKPEERAKREKEIQEEADKETRRMLWATALMIAFAVVKHVSESVGLELLSPTFKRLLDEDSAIPNRIINLAITFDHPRALPKDKVIALDHELRIRRFAQTIVRMLVVEHLYLYDVPYADKQAICAKLDIDLPKGHMNPAGKLIGKR